jgi:glutamate 5-kinase
VLAPDGEEVARGIAAYSDSDSARIMGRKSGEIESLLGFRGREELIHRDDLVILQHNRGAAQPRASAQQVEDDS